MGCQMGIESCFYKTKISVNLGFIVPTFQCTVEVVYQVLQHSEESESPNPSATIGICTWATVSNIICSSFLIMYFPLFTGVLILLALGLLTPYFYFIPKASLAAVIICAVIFMIEYEVVKPMWKSSRKFKPFVMTRILGLYTQQFPFAMWRAVGDLSTVIDCIMQVQKYHIFKLFQCPMTELSATMTSVQRATSRIIGHPFMCLKVMVFLSV
jgi:hypothetical protein